MGIAQQICNRVMSEAQGVVSTGLPIDIFPEKMQSVILDMVRYENYKLEYLVPSMLSATASALGGTYNIRVKNQWITNAAMYMILVGKPGLGKTPPLDAAYRPIRKADTLKLEKYKSELETYQNAVKESKGRHVLRDLYFPEQLFLISHPKH